MIEGKPRVCVLKTDGINCDGETMHAFNVAGGNANVVHVNELRVGEDSLRNYQVLTIPGGFSYGDDIRAGKVLSLELTSYLQDQITDFVERDKKLVLGICNGFQVLVRTGLLPLGTIGDMQETLAANKSGKFECDWVNLKVENDTPSLFTDGMNDVVMVPVAHGEGNLYGTDEAIAHIEDEKLRVFRYSDSEGNPTQEYRANPNGSVHAIAGMCDSSGRILGLMPHFERNVSPMQNPNIRRLRALGIPDAKSDGLQFFENIVNVAKQM